MPQLAFDNELSSRVENDGESIIGERLYQIIHQTQPELAGKITGMLLTMDNSELLHLLNSREALNTKIQEVLQLMHEFTSGRECQYECESDVSEQVMLGISNLKLIGVLSKHRNKNTNGTNFLIGLTNALILMHDAGNPKVRVSLMLN